MQAHKFTGWVLADSNRKAADTTEAMGILVLANGGVLTIEPPVDIYDPNQTVFDFEDSQGVVS